MTKVTVKTYKHSTNFMHIFDNVPDILCYDCNIFLRSCFTFHKCQKEVNIILDDCICSRKRKCNRCQKLDRCIEFWYPPPNL